MEEDTAKGDGANSLILVVYPPHWPLSTLIYLLPNLCPWKVNLLVCYAAMGLLCAVVITAHWILTFPLAHAMVQLVEITTDFLIFYCACIEVHKQGWYQCDST
jgi:hypothetical protein